MGVKRALNFRFPEFERRFSQGGNHTTTVQDVWQTVVEFSNKRGTMQLRHMRTSNANWFVYMRVTIDGVAYPISIGMKSGSGATYLFDFNESIKIEHISWNAFAYSRVEYAYNEYRP